MLQLDLHGLSAGDNGYTVDDDDENFPALASPQMRHCMGVIGAEGACVPSDQLGRSSMYC